ncbi:MULTISPECIES: DUF4238 domain-containing protein [unclassified Shewanella]|uniref:DUF4238 domain-containing protein n=1 Tax=unclassified Shewanella TaxID=196818 RepID=UPI002002CDB4|nr:MULTISPECIES: DUF4238 domain-containing protein [unclassified Shewanella]MCK7632646.1 DUF4238 domain-containing protein [Shewanella sp. JNE17]MCK7648158.1 DUF4238 domain-containing protein [Shewanella sp. JNE8]MCK7655951.1 DUF4238 domain-containing protein [Shewanella sp. JNE4-2]UPO32499.1 DUF4238 domain-containing protein [Shewanella sp. JNE2]
MKKRRHHYVWRNYLRSWSDNEQIWCVRNKKVFPTNLMNIGQERDFYRLNELTKQEVSFLTLLINQHTSEAIQKLNHGWVELFTAVFRIREQVNKHGLSDDEFEAEIEKQIINLGEDFHCGIEEGAIKFLDGFLDNGTNFLADEDNAIEFIHYFCVQYFRTKNMKENAASSVSELGLLDVDKAWNILSHMFSTSLAWSIYAERSQWSSVILENHTSSPFLTSDQPIINTYAAFDKQVKDHDELEFYYPLSPEKALLLTKRTEYKGVPSKSLNELEVSGYNDIMIDMSHEQIYSFQKEQLEMYVQKI